MTDLKDFNINIDLTPKKELLQRFCIRVVNCYELHDEKTRTILGRYIAFGNDDITARNKAIEYKNALIKVYGETYEI